MISISVFSLPRLVDGSPLFELPLPGLLSPELLPPWLLSPELLPPGLLLPELLFGFPPFELSLLESTTLVVPGGVGVGEETGGGDVELGFPFFPLRPFWFLSLTVPGLLFPFLLFLSPLPKLTLPGFCVTTAGGGLTLFGGEELEGG